MDKPERRDASEEALRVPGSHDPGKAAGALAWSWGCGMLIQRKQKHLAPCQVVIKHGEDDDLEQGMLKPFGLPPGSNSH